MRDSSTVHFHELVFAFGRLHRVNAVAAIRRTQTKAEILTLRLELESSGVSVRMLTPGKVLEEMQSSPSHFAQTYFG